MVCVTDGVDIPHVPPFPSAVLVRPLLIESRQVAVDLAVQFLLLMLAGWSH